MDISMILSALAASSLGAWLFWLLLSSEDER